MAHVVNPIYDTVFKYIMQDEKVAKVLIGNILKTKVVSIQMNNNEYAAMLPDGKKVFKLDFSATILDKENQQQLVHIEVQKALDKGNNSAEQLIKSMDAAVKHFVGGAQQSDDLTMLAVKFMKEDQ